MSLKLFVRYRGVPVGEVELHPEKTYRLGRSSNNDLQIRVKEIPRHIGEVKWHDNHWRFFPSPTSERSEILDQDRCYSNTQGLEIGLSTFLDHELTLPGTLFHSPEVEQRRWTWIWVQLACTFLFLTGGFYFGAFQLERPVTKLNSKTVMKFAESKILKFEMNFNPKELENLKRDAQLQQEDFKTTVGFCTGFAVDRNIVLTAQHCVINPPGFEMTSDFVLKTSDGREIKPIRILGMDYLQDYLFLEVEDLNNDEHFEFAKDFEIGQKVFTIGNVSGEGLAIREGIISGETEDINVPETKYIRFSAAASPGNSGGPLLNEQGEIVALVSRKNMSENYNVGIHFRDLHEAKIAIVDEEDRSDVVFKSKYSDLSISSLLNLAQKQFGIKYPDYVTHRTDLIEKFKDFEVAIPMPLEISKTDRTLEERFETAFKKLLESIESEGRSVQLPGVHWESQVTADLPVIIPGVQDVAQSTFRKSGPHEMIPYELGLSGHSGYFGYDETIQHFRKTGKFKYSLGTMALRGSLINQRVSNTKEKGYFLYSSTKDSTEPLDFTRLIFESPDFSISYLNSTMTPEEKNKILFETFDDVFFGAHGAIVNLKFFPFVRPKAKSEFRLKKFPEPVREIGTYLDEARRPWRYFVSSFYGTFFTEIFCSSAFRTTHCLTAIREGNFDEKKVLAAQNFISTELSDKFPLSEYFPTDDLQGLNAFLDSQIYLKDFNLQMNDKKNLVLSMKSREVEIPLGSAESVQRIRFIPGLVFNKEANEGQWQGFAAQVIRKSSPQSFEVCAVGLQSPHFPYHEFFKNAPGLTPKSSKKISSRQMASDEMMNSNTSGNHALALQEFKTCVPLTNFTGDDKIFDLDFSSKNTKKISR